MFMTWLMRRTGGEGPHLSLPRPQPCLQKGCLSTVKLCFLTFYFILEYSWLTMWWKFQVDSKGSLVQFSYSVISDSLDPMNHSTPGLPVHHQLPEFTQTHVHRAGDAIQPSHPLSSPSPPAPNPSQHQSLFQWVNSWHEVAKVLEFQL